MFQIVQENLRYPITASMDPLHHCVSPLPSPSFSPGAHLILKCCFVVCHPCYSRYPATGSSQLQWALGQGSVLVGRGSLVPSQPSAELQANFLIMMHLAGMLNWSLNLPQWDSFGDLVWFIFDSNNRESKFYFRVGHPRCSKNPKILLKSKTVVVCFSHKSHRNTNPRRNIFLVLKANIFSAKIEVVIIDLTFLAWPCTVLVLCH